MGLAVALEVAVRAIAAAVTAAVLALRQVRVLGAVAAVLALGQVRVLGAVAAVVAAALVGTATRQRAGVSLAILLAAHAVLALGHAVAGAVSLLAVGDAAGVAADQVPLAVRRVVSTVLGADHLAAVIDTVDRRGRVAS